MSMTGWDGMPPGVLVAGDPARVVRPVPYQA